MTWYLNQDKVIEARIAALEHFKSEAHLRKMVHAEALKLSFYLLDFHKIKNRAKIKAWKHRIHILLTTTRDE